MVHLLYCIVSHRSRNRCLADGVTTHDGAIQCVRYHGHWREDRLDVDQCKTEYRVMKLALYLVVTHTYFNIRGIPTVVTTTTSISSIAAYLSILLFSTPILARLSHA